MKSTTTRHFAAELPSSLLRVARRLRHRKGRQALGKFLVEGPQAVREALREPGRVRELLLADDFEHEEISQLAAQAGIEPRIVASAVLREITDTVTPQGVVAIANQLDVGGDLPADPKLVVVCDNIRDPGNAGTLIRCADAFGADAVVLSSGSVEVHNPKTVRASVGSIFHLPVIANANLTDTVQHLRAAGCQVLAADGSGEPLDKLAEAGELAKPTAWVLGNEAQGLGKTAIRLADYRVAVPMWGQAESLNLSTAAAICLYQTATAQNGRKNEGGAYVGTE